QAADRAGAASSRPTGRSPRGASPRRCWSTGRRRASQAPRDRGGLQGWLSFEDVPVDRLGEAVGVVAGGDETRLLLHVVGRIAHGYGEVALREHGEVIVV